MNDLPSAIYCDWKIYLEILFHIVQNAIKFSKASSEIRISVLYYAIEKVDER